MSDKTLGRLERVDLRDIWASEATEFTPWLAQPENLRLLGESIGIELELQAQEQNVGPFRADILCKDTASGQWVLIENQLERTDHTHLGQLLTYAAGLKTVSIVWVAREFTDEHRAALDWLNEITDEQFNFFGLEVELWRIGDSMTAPKFNIVCQPNDWSRRVVEGAESTGLTESKQLQQEFWTVFRAYVLERKSVLRPTKPLPQNWMNISMGRSGCRLAAVASFWDSVAESYDSNELRAEVVLDSEQSKQQFDTLAADKAEIEQEVGEQLTWYKPPNARMCRIYLRRSANLRDKGTWNEYAEWLLRKLEALHKAFSARVRNLSVEDQNGSPPDQ